MAQKIVVDTSVLIKWIKTKDEELVKEARRLSLLTGSSSQRETSHPARKEKT